jgi:hypothetical protein
MRKTHRVGPAPARRILRMPQTPEQQARQEIDAELTAAGRVIQDENVRRYLTPLQEIVVDV